GKIEVDVATQLVYVEKFASGTSPNYSIPIVAYRVSDDDGARAGAVTTDGVRQWGDEANRVFESPVPSSLTTASCWYCATPRSTTSRVRTIRSGASARDKLNQLAARHRSVVVVFRAVPGGGGFSSWSSDFVAMGFFDPNALGLLAHELGHHFGLPH